MKQYKIAIAGEGSANALAIRLLDLGRQLQTADVYDTVDQKIENKSFEDEGLTIEIEEA
jgi:hypothetical protein